MQILPQLIKRMKLVDIMTILGALCVLKKEMHGLLENHRLSTQMRFSGVVVLPKEQLQVLS